MISASWVVLVDLTSRGPQLSQDLMEGNFGITSLFRLEARGLKYVGGPKGNEKEKKTPNLSCTSPHNYDE